MAQYKISIETLIRYPFVYIEAPDNMSVQEISEMAVRKLFGVPNPTPETIRHKLYKNIFYSVKTKVNQTQKLGHNGYEDIRHWDCEYINCTNKNGRKKIKMY